ncbi:hypothetical protein [Niabella ginsengisoli]|uniref:MarR family transcriptional regulator n=1 Tax=Niabella ginsengisoli TaxID=522298 RepID=A0ABS9SMB6_9BACT|nr:hypothetical protein [Niabella ginsengisoli]MCH5599520.1 hypothetical protein [Niabella ginsengisoli]
MVEVRITEKGLQLLTKLDDIDQEMSTFLSNITEQEATIISNLLDKMHTKT